MKHLYLLVLFVSVPFFAFAGGAEKREAQASEDISIHKKARTQELQISITELLMQQNTFLESLAQRLENLKKNSEEFLKEIEYLEQQLLTKGS